MPSTIPNPDLPVLPCNRLIPDHRLERILINGKIGFDDEADAVEFVQRLAAQNAIQVYGLAAATLEEAQAGVSAALRAWSPQRIAQAIAALAPAPDLSGYALTSEVTAAITSALSDLTNGAPTALNQLNELANALGNDVAFSATVIAALAKRLRVDDVQSFTSGEKIQGRANLGLGTMALATATDYYPATDVFSKSQTLRVWANDNQQLTPQTPGIEAEPAHAPRLIVPSGIFSALPDGDQFSFRLMENGDDTDIVLFEIDSSEDGISGEDTEAMQPADWFDASALAAYLTDKLGSLGVTVTNLGDETVALDGPLTGSNHSVRIVTGWDAGYQTYGSDAGEPTAPVDGIVQVVLQAPTKSGGRVVPTQVSIRKQGAPTALSIDIGLWDGSTFTIFGRLDVTALVDGESVSIVDDRWDWNVDLYSHEKMVTGIADHSFVARITDLNQFTEPGNTFLISAHGLEI